MGWVNFICFAVMKVEILNPDWTFQRPELGQRDPERHLRAVKIESTKESHLGLLGTPRSRPWVLLETCSCATSPSGRGFTCLEWSWSWNIVSWVPLFTPQSISIWTINSMVAYLLGWFVQKKKKKKANRKMWSNTQKGCVFLILLRSRRQSKCSLFCKEPRHEYFLLSGPYSLCHDYSTPSSVTITIENT